MAVRGPGFFDRLDLLALRMVKSGRDKRAEILRRYVHSGGFWRLRHYAYLSLEAFEMVVNRQFPVLRRGAYRAIARVADRYVLRRDRSNDPGITLVPCSKRAVP